jgi:hypothetical protein
VRSPQSELYLHNFQVSHHPSQLTARLLHLRTLPRCKKDEIWDILTLTVGQKIYLRTLVAAEALAQSLGEFEYRKN